VRECCKGDNASQWRSPKFDPAATPKPTNVEQESPAAFKNQLDRLAPVARRMP